MGKCLFSNSSSSPLATGIAPGDTTVQVGPGDGALFPEIDGGSGDYFYIALENDVGDFEVCLVTATVGDDFTVVRGQDGTVAGTFLATVTLVEVRPTAAQMELLLQRTGDSMTGPLNMQGHEIIGAVLQGVEGLTDTELVIPANGDPPTIGGDPIVLQSQVNGVPVGGIILWSGSVAAVPSGWALCTGANGTPDLRGKFVLGAGGAYAVGVTGGAESKPSESGGSHNHGGSSGGTAITIAQLPPHTHAQTRNTSGGGSTGLALSGSMKTSTGAWLDQETLSTGGGDAHVHTISTEAAHVHTVDVMPPYYALCYIMKLPPAVT